MGYLCSIHDPPGCLKVGSFPVSMLYGRIVCRLSPMSQDQGQYPFTLTLWQESKKSGRHWSVNDAARQTRKEAALSFDVDL